MKLIFAPSLLLLLQKPEPGHCSRDTKFNAAKLADLKQNAKWSLELEPPSSAGKSDFGNKNGRNEIDVGVLSVFREGKRGANGRLLLGNKNSVHGSKVARFLQAEATLESSCDAGNCAPDYCECLSQSWTNNEANESGEVPCASELLKLCYGGYTDSAGTLWTAEGCASHPSYSAESTAVYMSKKCELAKCEVDGGTLGQCICQVSNSYCTIYGELFEASLGYESPFCEVDTCCQSKSNEFELLQCGAKAGFVYLSFGNSPTGNDNVGYAPVPVPEPEPFVPPYVPVPEPELEPLVPFVPFVPEPEPVPVESFPNPSPVTAGENAPTMQSPSAASSTGSRFDEPSSVSSIDIGKALILVSTATAAVWIGFA